MTLEDTAGAVALQRACFPAPFSEGLLWRTEHLQAHLRLFAGGQFVAVGLEEGVVGSASSAIVSEAVWQAHLSWEETLGGMEFGHHDPDGTTLYGADISVHPDHRGQGIARKLYEARFELVRRLGLARFGTACRIPGCRDWARIHGGGANDFVLAVESGATSDRTLTPLLRLGLRVAGVLQGYMEDEESLNAGALLEWTP